MSAAAWTWLVYMAGDNDLADQVRQDLSEMIAAGPGERVRVIVLADTPQGAACIEVTRNGLRELSHSAQANTGEVKVLQGFLAWGARYAPAARYAVVIWNHGNGVEDFFTNPALSTIGKGLMRTPGPLRARGTRITTARKRLFGAGKHVDRAIARDDGAGDFLDNRDIQTGLALKPAYGRVELLGFDACLMATAEIAHAVRASAPVVVASQANEGLSGWAWSPMIGATVRRPDLDGKALANLMVQAQGQYGTLDGLPGLTLSAVDGAAVEAARPALTDAVRALLPHLADPAVRVAVRSAWSGAPRFQPRCYADGDGLLAAIQSAVRPGLPDVAARFSGARAALKAAVLASRASGDWSGRATGLSLYAPLDLPVPEYEQLPFGGATGWSALIRAMTT